MLKETSAHAKIKGGGRMLEVRNKKSGGVK